jgi:hypothetical protein
MITHLKQDSTVKVPVIPEPFEAFRAKTQDDGVYGEIDVFAVWNSEGPMMCIMGDDGNAVYISKQQAMEFFGLVEPS